MPAVPLSAPRSHARSKRRVSSSPSNNASFPGMHERIVPIPLPIIFSRAIRNSNFSTIYRTVFGYRPTGLSCTF